MRRAAKTGLLAHLLPLLMFLCTLALCRHHTPARAGGLVGRGGQRRLGVHEGPEPRPAFLPVVRKCYLLTALLFIKQI